MANGENSELGCLVVFVLVGALIYYGFSNLGGHDQKATKESPTAPTTTAPQSPIAISPFLIELSDGKIVRSKAFKIDGDLRPIWVVSGRIQNNSPTELKSVTIKIDVISTATSNQVDETLLQIDTDILSGSAGSFSRDMQILPPESGYKWQWDVVKAVAK